MKKILVAFPIISRNGIVKERVEMTYYEAGHMMYIHEPDLIKLSGDIRRFLISK